MDVMYKSTRSDSAPITASQAILRGFPQDGGLYVPTCLPRLETSLSDLAAMDYQGVAYEVMRLLLTDYTKEELLACIRGAYDSKFDTPVIAPLKKVGDAYYLELFHGPTIAFKDMALSILPYLMTTAARKNGSGNEIVILTATSGDTGKAALEGFAGVPGTKIMVFYPKNGVSAIQERQMVTTVGDNTRVIGINGNFDDAQTSVKKLFTDSALVEEMGRNGMQFSSANSINIGRLTPQIVYYVYAYTRLLRDGVISEGEKINFTVPTGNFGNILAAYYAKRMGLPVEKLICASNSNKVLFDFFESGCYDRKREFILTSSPSMDILISSNLERLIYHICGEDPSVCRSFMEDLVNKGVYNITEQMRAQLSDFVGGYATEEETAAQIRETYGQSGYVMDPHTAVGGSVYKRYRASSGDTAVTVIDSTASPFKFEGSVMKALGEDTSLPDLELAEKLSVIAGVPVPKAVSDLRDAPVMHDIVCDREQMRDEVRKFLGLA